MTGLFAKYLKGIKAGHRKHTQDFVTETMPVPDIVRIAMSQHMGPPCDILVKPNDTVKVGQVIGDSKAFLSAPIHSGVSGTVERIDEIIMPNGTRSKTAVIRTDQLQECAEGFTPPQVDCRADFIAAVRASGAVGLGGAGFPTHIKLNPKGAVDFLVINAAECEPYITADYRTLIEDFSDALDGILTIVKYLDIRNCAIGIEDNKPQAIAMWSKLVQDIPRLTIHVLKSKYPKGAEKVLIYEATGRIVPEGKLPADIGVVVINITTAAFIARYLKTGLPLTSKRITVDGGAINQPKNIRAVIGTPVSAIAEFCGGYQSPPAKILLGGPMMGVAIHDENYSVMKNSNAVLFLDEKEARTYRESPCIHCGRCVRACPMNLMPLRIDDCFERNDNDGLRRYKVNLCMECGCCSFVCPAKRHLVHTNRLAKARLREASRKKEA